jgi:hypothetical protein
MKLQIFTILDLMIYNVACDLKTQGFVWVGYNHRAQSQHTSRNEIVARSSYQVAAMNRDYKKS